MDVYKETFQGWNPELNEMEMFIRLTVVAVTVLLMSCCCCCCILINRGESIDAEFDSGNLLEEIQDIEQQSSNYEEALRIARKRRRGQLQNGEDDDMTSDVNDEVGIRSDSWEALDESNIGDYGNEYVIINTCDTEDGSVDTSNIEKDSDLKCSSRDEKSNTSNISNDSDIILLKNREDTVDKCNSSYERSHQIDKLCDSSNEISDQWNSRDDNSGKPKVGGDTSKCDAASESNVGSGDSRVINNPGS